MEKNITDKPLLACASSRDDRHHKREEVEDLEDRIPQADVFAETDHFDDVYVKYKEGEQKEAVTPKVILEDHDSQQDRYHRHEEVAEREAVITEVIREEFIVHPEDVVPIPRHDSHHDRYHKYEEATYTEELQAAPREMASHDLRSDRYVKSEKVKKVKDVTLCTTDDEKRMENIKKLLMTATTTEKRKRIVRQYLDWFKTILTSKQKKVTLETPLTDGDCEFLRLLYIPAVTGQKELNWQNLSDRSEIHRYGVLFKHLFDFTDKAWEELQNILDAGR